MKGVFQVENCDSRYLLQAVHNMIDLRKSTKWEEGERRTNRLVCIGTPKALDWLKIRQRFEACFVDKPELYYMP